MLGQSVVFETNTLNSSESSNRRALARAKMLGQSPEIVSKPVSIQQIQQNVEKAVSNSQVQPLISLANELKREKVTPIRKAIAKAMKNSWSNVAYTNLVNEINVGSLVSLREKIKDSVQDLTGVKVTFLPFIIKAITLALKEFPVLMAKYDEQASELVYSGTLNIGIAVDTEAGLMVPVIKNADKLNIIEIAKEITRLAVAARDKKIKADELKGSDFTVTNYASVGSLFGIPVINYPDMAIAGIGVIKDEPIVTKNGIVAGKIMNLTVAADHRWVDGATIGRFAQKVKHFLENPELLGVF
ncbi:2-oxo acid dehydrogenase subunit E2 [[Mycoplasma] mobile]